MKSVMFLLVLISVCISSVGQDLKVRTEVARKNLDAARKEYNVYISKNTTEAGKKARRELGEKNKELEGVRISVMQQEAGLLQLASNYGAARDALARERTKDTIENEKNLRKDFDYAWKKNKLDQNQHYKDALKAVNEAKVKIEQADSSLRSSDPEAAKLWKAVEDNQKQLSNLQNQAKAKPKPKRRK